MIPVLYLESSDSGVLVNSVSEFFRCRNSPKLGAVVFWEKANPSLWERPAEEGKFVSSEGGGLRQEAGKWENSNSDFVTFDILE